MQLGANPMRGSEATGLGARAALIATTLLVALPGSWASLWGGRQAGPWWPAFAVSAFWAAITIGGALFAGAELRKQRPVEWISGLLLLVDVTGLTLLLRESGAAQNPFSMLYFVPITLATVVARRWTWGIATAAVVSFTLLLIQTAKVLAPHRNHPHHAHFFEHVQGMAIALAISGAFITFFVLRVSRSLERKQSQIEELSRAQQEDRFAVALGALSAGAAHELGSPLATVQILAEELPHLEATERSDALKTIQQQVQRMKLILHSMKSSELSAEVLEGGAPWDPASLTEELPGGDSPRSITHDIDAPMATSQPESIVRQIVRELMRNAERASETSAITLVVRTTQADLRVEVRDSGPGVPAQIQQGTAAPFVSGTGGTGLGLFLASVHARQLGGEFSLSRENSPRDPSGVTVARLQLPRIRS